MTTRDPQQLSALEAWRSSQLEQARSELEKEHTLAAERRQEVSTVTSALDDIRQLHRSAYEGQQSLSADRLERLAQYASLQESQLRTANAALEASQQAVDRARRAVHEKWASLSVIEKLRERREQQQKIDNERREQRRLDDQALMRESVQRHIQGQEGD